MFLLIWIASIIATIIIAKQKELSLVAYGVAAFFLGPIGLLIALAMPTGSTSKDSSGKVETLQEAQRQLDSIKTSLFSLQNQVNSLAKRINEFLGKEKIVQELPSGKTETSSEKGKVPVKAVSAQEQAVSHDYEEMVSVLEGKKAKKEGFEFVFGKYWLNRIGVALFVLGIGFFISYTFRYLNAFAKVLIGYLASVSFFIWGNILEKNKKYIRVAWGILGGAWALLYLSTYSMYYIEATRLITNPILELWLLAIASFAAIVYNLRYRSWTVTSITFLLGFITAGLGGIEYSTIIYCAFLIGAVVYLSYKLNWYKFLLFGICAAYITYMCWLHPQIFTAFLTTQKFTIPVYQFQLCFSLLSITWILFTLALFLLKVGDPQKLKYIVGGILLNSAFFIFLGLAELYRVKPHLQINWDIRFWFLILLSVIYFLYSYVYKLLNKPKLIVSNVSIASTLVAMAIMVRFPRLSIGFFWLLEMAALFIIGIYYKEFAYRVLAGILGVLIFLRLFIVDYLSDKYYWIFGIDIKHNIVIFIFAAICFCLLGTMVKNSKIRGYLSKGESNYFSSFIVLGTVLVTFLFLKEAEAKFLSLTWALEGVAILTAGFLLKDKVYRICALCVFSLTCLRLFFIDMAGLNTIYKIITFICLGAILLVSSMIYSKFIIKR